MAYKLFVVITVWDIGRTDSANGITSQLIGPYSSYEGAEQAGIELREDFKSKIFLDASISVIETGGTL